MATLYTFLNTYFLGNIKEKMVILKYLISSATRDGKTSNQSVPLYPLLKQFSVDAVVPMMTKVPSSLALLLSTWIHCFHWTMLGSKCQHLPLKGNGKKRAYSLPTNECSFFQSYSPSSGVHILEATVYSCGRSQTAIKTVTQTVFIPLSPNQTKSESVLLAQK